MHGFCCNIRTHIVLLMNLSASERNVCELLACLRSPSNMNCVCKVWEFQRRNNTIFAEVVQLQSIFMTCDLVVRNVQELCDSVVLHSS